MQFEFLDNDDALMRRSARGRDPVLDLFAEALRNNPGRWAKWPKEMSPSSVSSTTSRINHPDQNSRQPYQCFKGGGFEAATRRGIMYVRYIG